MSNEQFQYGMTYFGTPVVRFLSFSSVLLILSLSFCSRLSITAALFPLQSFPALAVKRMKKKQFVEKYYILNVSCSFLLSQFGLESILKLRNDFLLNIQKLNLISLNLQLLHIPFLARDSCRRMLASRFLSTAFFTPIQKRNKQYTSIRQTKTTIERRTQYTCILQVHLSTKVRSNKYFVWSNYHSVRGICSLCIR